MHKILGQTIEATMESVPSKKEKQKIQTDALIICEVGPSDEFLEYIYTWSLHSVLIQKSIFSLHGFFSIALHIAWYEHSNTMSKEQSRVLISYVFLYQFQIIETFTGGFQL